MEIKESGEEILKITVTKEAGDSLNTVLSKANEGFDAGKITRQDIASWILIRFEKSFDESDIQQIRNEFFSEKVLLETILKRVKSSGEVPEFLRDVLKKNWQGISEGQGAESPSHRRAAKKSETSKIKVKTENSNQNLEGV